MPAYTMTQRDSNLRHHIELVRSIKNVFLHNAMSYCIGTSRMNIGKKMDQVFNNRVR